MGTLANISMVFWILLIVLIAYSVVREGKDGPYEGNVALAIFAFIVGLPLVGLIFCAIGCVGVFFLSPLFYLFGIPLPF